MGYTHYIKKTAIKQENWDKFIDYCKQIFDTAINSWGIDLDYEFVKNKKLGGVDMIVLNGSEHQRLNKWVDTTKKVEQAGLVWPSSNTVLINDQPKVLEKNEWDFGITADMPVCPYDSITNTWSWNYETFVLKQNNPEFDFCKTNYRPYDVVVQAILLLLHTMCDSEEFVFSSDGQKKDFVLGYLLLKEATGIKAREPDFMD